MGAGAPCDTSVVIVIVELVGDMGDVVCQGRLRLGGGTGRLGCCSALGQGHTRVLL